MENLIDIEQSVYALVYNNYYKNGIKLEVRKMDNHFCRFVLGNPKNYDVLLVGTESEMNEIHFSIRTDVWQKELKNLIKNFNSDETLCKLYRITLLDCCVVITDIKHRQPNEKTITIEKVLLKWLSNLDDNLQILIKNREIEIY